VPGVRRAEDRVSEAPEEPRTREQPAAQGGLRFDAGQAHSAGGRAGKLLTPARRRACIEQVRAQLHVSERRACAALGQHRSTQRKVPRGRDDEERLTADIIELARQYGRYGYGKIAGCCGRPLANSTTSGSSVSRDARGSRFPIANAASATMPSTLAETGIWVQRLFYPATPTLQRRQMARYLQGRSVWFPTKAARNPR
jgi:hypothetical protein